MTSNLFWIGPGLYETEIRGLKNDPVPFACLERLALYNRINTLSAIFNARRGWLGASLSAAEILTCLYFDLADIDPADPLSRDLILLGKGHAASIQYACLAGRGILSVEDLGRLNQCDGPQAHPDRLTPGIAANGGSLGQALSKACGLAMGQNRRVFVVLGDGELQEGQNWEAIQTIHRYGLSNVIPIIDRNGIQTGSAVADVKPVPDLGAVIEGFGLQAGIADGNRIHSVYTALKRARDNPRPAAVIADTRKAAGIPFMEANHTERGGFRWHGPVTGESDYRAALEALAAAPEAGPTGDAIRKYLSAKRPATASVRPGREKELSTGEAFGRALVRLAAEYPELTVLDADLEKACRLSAFARNHPGRFLEMGIAEQDMAGCAGGPALAGWIPVVNTYAAFLRRAFEQIYMNATEGTRILYAGHYAGLCYFADGKSHQCTGDVAMMRSIPGMAVLYPAFPGEVEPMLRWILEGGWNGPAYFRLHRSPAEIHGTSPPEFRFGRGIRIRETDGKTALVTAGPHMTSIVLSASKILGKQGKPCDVLVFSTLRPVDPGSLADLLGGYVRIFILEELHETGGLSDEIHLAFSRIGGNFRPPVIRHRAVRDLTFGTLDPSGLYAHFGFTPEAVARWIGIG